MAKVNDEQLARWTKPAFDNEEERADYTEQLIREAVKAHPLLSRLDVRVLAKGSIKNSTNVRRDSDIDVAVEYRGIFQLDYVGGASFAHTGLTPYNGPFKDSGMLAYKAAVGEAMRSAFGSSAVDGRGNKVFTVRESSRSLAADVVPCASHRIYWPTGGYIQGIELILNRPDGQRHYNYPEQHYDNGVAKNNRTGRRYKRVVRILKNMENALVATREIEVVPSFLIECMAYNVSDAVYNQYDTYREIVQHVLAEMWAYLSAPEPAMGRWLEVSHHKWLFHSQQHWTREDAKRFVLAAAGMVF